MTGLDLSKQLRDAINALPGLSYRCILGGLEVSESIALYPSGNSQTVETHYDGAVSKVINYTFEIKTQGKNLEAENSLRAIGAWLETAANIPSKNDSYEFEGVLIPNEPYASGYDDKKNYYYTLTIGVQIFVTRRNNH